MTTAINTRAMIQDLRVALDMYEAAQLGYEPGTLPIEVKIANATVQAIIPRLKAMLSVLNETRGEWTTARNGIDAKIVAHFVSGEPLAEYDPRDWIVWGQMLAWFNAFLMTPQTITYPDGQTEQLTPWEVLNIGYVKMQPAQAESA